MLEKSKVHTPMILEFIFSEESFRINQPNPRDPRLVEVKKSKYPISLAFSENWWYAFV